MLSFEFQGGCCKLWTMTLVIHFFGPPVGHPDQQVTSGSSSLSKKPLCSMYYTVTIIYQPAGGNNIIVNVKESGTISANY